MRRLPKLEVVQVPGVEHPVVVFVLFNARALIRPKIATGLTNSQQRVQARLVIRRTRERRGLLGLPPVAWLDFASEHLATAAS
jgi:hypothetical protein